MAFTFALAPDAYRHHKTPVSCSLPLSTAATLMTNEAKDLLKQASAHPRAQFRLGCA